MIKLYFDGKEIEKDYYRSLTQSFILFDKSFYLGSVPSNTFRIELNNKANIITFDEAKIELDDEDYAHVYYDNLETSNGSKEIIPLSDAMVDFEFNYDASPLIENNSTGYVTILEILEDICSKKGITLATKDFNLKEKQITWYDSTISARKYISYIATLNGGFAKINRKGELELVRYTNEIKAEIDTRKDYKIGEHHKITRVVWDIGTDIWEYGDETGDTLYLDTDNPFITEKTDVESIFNLIKDFEFYSMEISKCPIDSNIEIGDIIAFRKDDKLYPFIAQLEYSYNGGFRGGYKTILNTKKVEETSVNDTQKNIKSIKTRLNRDEAKLEIIAEESKETSKNLEDLRTPILTKEGNNHICAYEAYETNAIEYNIDGKCEQENEPSPEYSSEIKTIKGINNSFNINDLELNDSLSVTSKIEKNALILTNSDNNANSYIRYKLFNTNKKERKTYTFSCYAKTNGNNLAQVNIFYADENGNNRTEIANTNATKEGILKCTFTLNHSFNENQKNILILFYGSYNAGNLKDTLATYTDIQLEESSIAHSYVPYGSWLKSKVLSKNLANIANFNVSANHAWKNIFDVVDNTEYTLSFIKSRISDIPIVNNSINQIGEIRYYHDETLLSSIVIPLPYVTISSGSHKTIYPFVTPDKCNNIAIDFTNNNGDGNLNTMVSDIQLEENQEATEYESFQEKEIFVDINKPNLFNFLNIINKSNINANGEIVEDPSQAFDINFIKVIPKKKYKLVSDYERQFVLSFYKDLPKIGSVGTSRIVKNNIFTETVTVPEDYNYLAIRHGMDALTTEDNSKLKIYEGLDSYYELNSIKEVADSLEVNHGTLEKRIGKIILDGTTGTFTAPDNSNENFIQVNIQIPNIEFQCSSVGDEFLCTHFSYYEKATSTGKEREGLKLFNSGNYYAFVFSVSTTIATTIEEFKNWLKENPITIYYILKEPETIHLTPTKIPLFENENHLTLLEDIETKTDIKYHRIHVFNEAFYTKEETNAQLEIKANEINLGVESNKTELKNGFLEINEKFGNYALQQVLVEQINSVLQKITDSEARINILNQTIANGVPITKTETGYTFDINGLNISSTDAEVNSTLSSLGLSILDNISKEVLLYAGYDKDLQETIVKARNMIIEKYFTVAHCRIEEFKDPDLGIGTGFFYVD